MQNLTPPQSPHLTMKMKKEYEALEQQLSLSQLLLMLNIKTEQAFPTSLLDSLTRFTQVLRRRIEQELSLQDLGLIWLDTEGDEEDKEVWRLTKKGELMTGILMEELYQRIQDATLVTTPPHNVTPT